MEVLRTCTYCRIVKPLDDFYKHRNYGKFNRDNICKTCKSVYNYTKYDCECGKQYSMGHKKRHESSRYHISRLAQSPLKNVS